MANQQKEFVFGTPRQGMSFLAKLKALRSITEAQEEIIVDPKGILESPNPAIEFSSLQSALPNHIIIGSPVDSTTICYANSNTYKNVAAIGGSGSGKTTLFIIPHIISAIARGEHVVVFDPKGELKERLEPILTGIQNYQICQYSIDPRNTPDTNNLMDETVLATLVNKLVTHQTEKNICFIQSDIWEYNIGLESQIAETLTALMDKVISIARNVYHGPVPTPISFCIDDGEFICSNSEFPNTLSKSNESGVSIALCLQGFSALNRKQIRWTTIFDSFQLILCYGSVDSFTANYLHQLYQAKEDTLFRMSMHQLMAFAHGHTPYLATKLNYEWFMNFITKGNLLQTDFFDEVLSGT